MENEYVLLYPVKTNVAKVETVAHFYRASYNKLCSLLWVWHAYSWRNYVCNKKQSQILSTNVYPALTGSVILLNTVYLFLKLSGPKICVTYRGTDKYFVSISFRIILSLKQVNLPKTGIENFPQIEHFLLIEIEQNKNIGCTLFIQSIDKS